jgi:hypothetical protein
VADQRQRHSGGGLAQNGLHAGAGVLMLKPRSSTFLLAEIGDGDGSNLIWTEQKGARD